MAPTRSSGNARSSSLRQGTLSFASSKRTASTSTAGKQKKAVVTPPSETNEDVTSNDSAESQQAYKPYKRVKDDQMSRPAKRRHISPSPEVAPKTQSEDEVKDERSILDPRDKRWVKIHAAAKQRMKFPTLGESRA